MVPARRCGWVALLTWASACTSACSSCAAADMNPLTTTESCCRWPSGVPVGICVFALAAADPLTWLRRCGRGRVRRLGRDDDRGRTGRHAISGTAVIAGDAGRMSALVMHFSTTWHPSDAADPYLAPEYPPLYPMLIGRVAAMDRPAGVDAAAAGRSRRHQLRRRRRVPALAPADQRCRGVAGQHARCSSSLAEPSKGNEILSLVDLPALAAGHLRRSPGRRCRPT